jgi:hypothetical protein
MKYAVEMCLAAMLCIPSLIKNGSAIRMIVRGDTQTAWRLHKPTLGM